MYKTIIVVDDVHNVDSDNIASFISFENYLSNYPKKNQRKIRIINLCDTEHYLSRGYYCSLLAEARQHRVLPNVSTINDLRDNSATTNFPLLKTIDVELSSDTPREGLIFFGHTHSDNPSLQKLGKKIFDHYSAPLLYFRIFHDKGSLQLEVKRQSFSYLNDEDKLAFFKQLDHFINSVWVSSKAKRHLRWNMAILVNPDEAHPPSDKKAIKHFVKAAAKVGILADVVTPDNINQIAQYDALFIRETTAIDHHTYRLARRAERDGLVVIDDSQSILRCCNKVFLHDAFTYNNVSSLPTRIITSNSVVELDAIEAQFGFPLVLKLPEGAFSLGVFKIKTRQELEEKVSSLLQETSLLLAQQYLFTEYDWRIGVLNGRAIYACRYFMARNHWQIYNHSNKRSSSGGFETLPTFEVPKAVLSAAIKASLMIGRGLYGVDIKQDGKHVYVIEVNDNPSIDSGVEDKYLGKELYMHVMSEFAQRLEKRGR